MRWLAAGAAVGMLIAGYLLTVAARPTESRDDDDDLALVIGGAAVVSGVFVLTVLAVTT